MSITDELREYAQRYKNSYDAWSGIGDDLDHIADRIDAEHENAMAAAALIAGVPMTDGNMAEHGWVRLPKDADGEYIRIGDVMESKGGDLLFGEVSFEVRAMRYDEGRWEVYYAPALLRHYHAPTLEDVLLEALSKATFETEAGRKILVDEYAPKLREVLGVDDGE